MKTAFRACAIAYVALLAIYGCAGTGGGQETFISASYKTLSVINSGYMTAMSAAGDLYKKGLLDEDQREGVEKAGGEVKRAYDAARDALLAYAAGEASATKAGVDADVAKAQGAYKALISLAEPITQIAIERTK